MVKRKRRFFPRARLLYPVLSHLMRLLVREQTVPAEPELDRSRPICYVLESDALSNLLILQQTCRKRGLPMPLDDLAVCGLEDHRAVIALQELRGIFARRPNLRTHFRHLSDFVQAVETGACHDLQLVPVSIFLGRTPDKEASFFRIVFSENWPIAGRFRRLLSLLIYGREALVQFSRPLSIAQLQAEPIGRPRMVRKISRMLRVNFRRVRAAVIGPDLSHRRTLVDDILRSPEVREAIRQSARRNNQSIVKVRRRARKYAEEIAADYSYPVVRVVARSLTWVWNRIFDGVQTHHFDQLAAVAEGSELIYVPCHRSHMDYLLVSYLLYHHGLVVPHIAAGVNLNIPVVGSLLRRGGAFFLRRSFRGDALYSAVFHEYVDTIFAKGVSMEYFIEGGRSRTGRALQPRTGMLAMTVRSHLRHHQRPTVFVPIYVGYERLAEGGSYLGELSGGAKKKESLWSLMRSVRIVRENFGQVHVSFGEPIWLDKHLDGCNPDWRDHDEASDEKPRWLTECVDTLAHRIMVQINEAANVNPINLVALAILSSSKNALAEEDLVEQIELYQKLIRELPYAPLVTVTDRPAAEILAHAESMGVIERVSHPLGDILRCDERNSFLLSYFRNNALHVTVVYSWCACVFMNNVTFTRTELLRIGRVVYGFLKGELFLRWDREGFAAACDRCIEIYRREGLLIDTGDPELLQRAPGGSSEALHLRMLGQNVFASLERYYLVVALLTRHGSGSLTTGELENLCHLTAQRLSIIYTLDTPEYFDKTLFKQFIRRLKDRGVLDTREDGKLTYDPILETVVEDAKVLLSKDVRHSIMQVTPQKSAA